MDENIYSKVATIVSYQLGHVKFHIAPDLRLADDLGADSLAHVELMIAMEEEFPVKIPNEDADKILTVGDMVNYIEQHTD